MLDLELFNEKFTENEDEFRKISKKKEIESLY